MHAVHIKDIDLNLLRVLDALLETRHVSKAAARLGLSQPAVSHALRKLRGLLGDELLVRTGAGLERTAQADALARSLRIALENLQDAVGRTHTFTPATAKRSFNIGAADYAEFLLLPELMHTCARQAPDVDMWLHRPEQHRLQSGELDLCLDVRPQGLAGIKGRALFGDRFVVVMRKGHPLAKKRLSLSAYANAAHAFVAPGSTRGGPVDVALAQHGKSRRVAAAVPHFLVAPYVVARTDLVLTVGERIAKRFAGHLPLRIVEAPLSLPDFTISMLWHERLDRDPGHVWLRSKLVDTVASL